MRKPGIGAGPMLSTFTLGLTLRIAARARASGVPAAKAFSTTGAGLDCAPGFAAVAGAALWAQADRLRTRPSTLRGMRFIGFLGERWPPWAVDAPDSGTTAVAHQYRRSRLRTRRAHSSPRVVLGVQFLEMFARDQR